ncbi:MAG TPA: hypothetical protein VGR20_06110 [Acidimicrobiia bacterium]|nr:hypothetical protein [Acidimicrobiia bacterium]
MRPNRHPLDDDSASRMLQGLVHPDDAPPGFAPVAGLLASAAQMPAVDEEAGATTISAMVEAIRSTTTAPEPLRRRSMIGKLFAGKALAAMATVALTATGAAAATGTLPTPVQGAVAGAVSHIGIDLPNDDQTTPAADDPAHDANDDNGGNGGNGGNNGAGAGGHAADDPASHDANDDNGANGANGDVISGIAHDPALAGQPKGPTVCAAASDGKCQAGDDHGNSGDGSSNTGGHGSDDPATHDVGDDHGGSHGSSTTSTTVTTGSTTSTTTDDHGGSHGSGSGASDDSGKGKSGH